jgi:hypothetical protein
VLLLRKFNSPVGDKFRFSSVIMLHMRQSTGAHSRFGLMLLSLPYPYLFKITFPLHSTVSNERVVVSTLRVRQWCDSTFKRSTTGSFPIHDSQLSLPNVVIEWLTLLLRIREGPGWNHGLEKGYPEVFRGFPQYLHATTRITSDSFQNLYNSSFTYRPFIRRYTAGVAN